MKKILLLFFTIISYQLFAQGDITRYKFEYDSNWKCLTDASSFKCETMISIENDSIIYVENDYTTEVIYWDSVGNPVFFDSSKNSNVAVDLFKNDIFVGRIMFDKNKNFIGFIDIIDCKYVLYVNDITSMDNFF